MPPPSAPTKVPEDTKSPKIDSEETYLSWSLAGGKPQPTYPGKPQAPLQPDNITPRKRGRPTKAEIDHDTLPRNEAGGLATSNYGRSKASRPNDGFTPFEDSQLPSGVPRAKGSTLDRGVDERASAWQPAGTSAVETQDAAQIENEQTGDGDGDGENFMDLIARYTLLDERDLIRARS
jgi:hypothetical protein